MKAYRNVARIHVTETEAELYGVILPKNAHSPQPVNDGTLPDGWKEYADPKSGKVYYHNAHLGLSDWTKPEKGMV